MQTIFLDIDGVLHPCAAAGSLAAGELLRWSPLLAEVVGSAELHIVIHSTWRHSHSLAEIRLMFPESLRARIVACTQGRGRFDGIRLYVAEHALTDYLVLDDIAEFFPPDWPNLLLCTGETGISDPLVQARLRIFLAAAGAKAL